LLKLCGKQKFVCYVLLFGSIYQHYFLETATCFTCFSLLKITLLNTVQNVVVSFNWATLYDFYIAFPSLLFLPD